MEVMRRGGVAFCSMKPPDTLPNKSSTNYQTTSGGAHQNSSHGRDTVMMQIKQNDINGQGISCKIVPKDGRGRDAHEYLLAPDKHLSNSLNSLDSLKHDHKGGKGCGTGRKGKALDKSQAVVRSSHSAEPLPYNHFPQEDGLPAHGLRPYSSNCSSPGSMHGHETPV